MDDTVPSRQYVHRAVTDKIVAAIEAGAEESLGTIDWTNFSRTQSPRPTRLGTGLSSRPWHPWSNLGSQETNFKMRHYHRVEAVAFLGRSVEK